MAVRVKQKSSLTALDLQNKTTKLQSRALDWSEISAVAVRPDLQLTGDNDAQEELCLVS